MMSALTKIASIFRDPLWSGLSAIATSVLALLTFMSLRQYRRKEQKVEDRELVEKIIQPILQDFELLTVRPLQDFYVSQPRWPTIKKENPVIIYRIPNQITLAIDTLCTDIEKIQLRINNNILLLGIANRIIEKLNNKPANYDYGFANQTSYRWRIKNGKSFWFTFPSFLCANSTLAEEIEKSKEEVVNAVIEDEVFSAGGREWREVTRLVFDQILANIKNDIAGNPELTEYIQMFRDFYPKAVSLKNRLENLKRQLSR